MKKDAALVPVRPGGQLVVAPEVAETVARAVEASVPDNTKRAYATGWAQFEEFCRTSSATALPATPETVAAFIAGLANEGKSMATIELRLAAIAAAHRMRGFDSPGSADLVRRTLQGLRKLKGVAPVQKAPVTLAVLKKLVKAVDEDDDAAAFAKQRDRTLLLVGYSLAMRRSELVAMQWSDLEVVEGSVPGLVVTVRRSKTDQAGEGRALGLPAWLDKNLCPVVALTKLRDVAPESDWVFTSQKSVLQHLNPGHVAELVKWACGKARLDPKLYAGHSLRAGHVTEAFERGLEPAEIMAVTGHKSLDMLLRYERRAPMKRGTSGKVGQ